MGYMGNLVCPKCQEPHAVSQQLEDHGRETEGWHCEKCGTPFFEKKEEKISKGAALEAMLSDEVVVDKAPTDPDAPEFSEIQEKIKKGEIKVEFAPELHVGDLGEYVDRVLDALGFGTAWVSDMSCVSDFPLDSDDLEKASQELGVEVGFSDYIYQVAQRLKDSES